MREHGREPQDFNDNLFDTVLRNVFNNLDKISLSWWRDWLSTVLPLIEFIGSEGVHSYIEYKVRELNSYDLPSETLTKATAMLRLTDDMIQEMLEKKKTASGKESNKSSFGRVKRTKSKKSLNTVDKSLKKSSKKSLKKSLKKSVRTRRK